MGLDYTIQYKKGFENKAADVEGGQMRNFDKERLK